MLDISVSVTIPVITWDGFTQITTIIGLFILYWVAKAIVSVATGG